MWLNQNQIDKKIIKPHSFNRQNLKIEKIRIFQLQQDIKKKKLVLRYLQGKKKSKKYQRIKKTES